jgi:hypothetical protein
MNNTEAVLILRTVRAYRPAQTVDSLTGEAWAEALNDINFNDARQAVTTIAKASSAWIDPAIIRVEVKRIRAARCAQARAYLPSNNDLTPLEQKAEYRTYWQHVGNGTEPPAIDQAQYPRREIRVLTKGINE